MATSGYYIINLSVGEKKSIVITWKTGDDELVDLTSYSASLKIAVPNQDDLEPTVTLGGVDGTITIHFDTITLCAGEYPYDLYMTSPDETRKLLYGPVVIAGRVL